MRITYLFSLDNLEIILYKKPMGAFSIWHWIIVLIIVLLLFGKGKIPTLMGDMAKGIKSFKKNMSDEDNASTSDSDNKDSSNKDQ